jgi:peptidyl-tRNA hydrolase
MVYRLYILMRNDLNSLNPGKACAQAAHAANMAVSRCPSTLFDHLSEWERETGDGFGTTIVLGVNEQELYETINAAISSDMHAGTVHDPSYPLKDGKVTHYIPLDTCGFIFGPREMVEQITDDLYLMD